MEKVYISRKWHRPEVIGVLTDEEVGVVMELEDFKLALLQELCNNMIDVKFIFSKETFEKKFKEVYKKSCEEVELEIRRHSANIMARRKQ